MKYIHIVPANDERPHISVPDCPCKPHLATTDPETGDPYEFPMVIHHAYDCREVCEGLIGEGLDNDKFWMKVVIDTEDEG